MSKNSHVQEEWDGNDTDEDQALSDFYWVYEVRQHHARKQLSVDILALVTNISGAVGETPCNSIGLSLSESRDMYIGEIPQTLVCVKIVENHQAGRILYKQARWNVCHVPRRTTSLLLWNTIRTTYLL